MNRAEMISVIVPCYNIAPYVKHCIYTIQKQSYIRMEIVLVDDGSDDKTSSILDELVSEDNRISVIHQPNGGVTSARLSGIQLANGEWIGFVDGDDSIEPDMYERLIQNAVNYHADISHCGYQMVFPSRVDYYYNTGRLVCQDKITGLKDLLTGTFVEPGLWNKLFRKDLFQSMLQDKKMDLSIKNTEDLLMNYYLFREAESAVYEDFCPYHYNLRRGSAATSALNENKLKDPLKVLLLLEEETKSCKPINLCIKKNTVAKLINLSTLYTGKQEDLIKPFREHSRRELLHRLPEILRGEYAFKLKVFSVWAVIFPYSYYLVHSAYSNISGHNKRYEVK